ncbi:redoxin domain-containing protein [Solibacillus sp. FSL R7-0682]|uniref:redoxin domain-containing protein n=1 Tax=Solibacillus sp. FSL R7-0682 TaxID=2921690 RepID=UPI0030F887C0
MKRYIQIVIISLIGVAICSVILSTVLKKKEAQAKRDTFALLNTENEKVTIDQQGSVILNFWATYCPPCEREMPALEAAYPSLQEKGIDLYAINVEEPTKLVNHYLSKFKLSFPILLDRDGDVKNHFHIMALPTTLYIKNGEIVHTVKGELTEEQLLHFAKLMEE